MEKRDFERCQLCGTPFEKIQYDSPLYCDKCLSEMLKKNLTAGQYAKTISTK